MTWIQNVSYVKIINLFSKYFNEMSMECLERYLYIDYEV